jgi:hypothetical protein
MLADQSALLAFVYVGPDRRILGYYAPAVARIAHQRRRAPAMTDALETVLCASLVADVGAQRLAPAAAAATSSLFRQASEGRPRICP